MILNDEQRKKVLDNMGLVYHVMLKKLDIPPCDFEDVSQIGVLGLMKATLSFDERKGAKFSTFASMCIQNEILMFYRKENKRRISVISLEEDIFNMEGGEENNKSTLYSRLADDKDHIQDFLDRDEFESRINLLLNALTARERVITLFRLGEYSQKDISKCLKLSQSYISRLEKNISEKLIALQKCTFPTIDWKYVFKFDGIEYELFYKIPRKLTREELRGFYDEHILKSGHKGMIRYCGDALEVKCKQNSYFFLILAHLELLLQPEKILS